MLILQPHDADLGITEFRGGLRSAAADKALVSKINVKTLVAIHQKARAPGSVMIDLGSLAPKEFGGTVVNVGCRDDRMDPPRTPPTDAEGTTLLAPLNVNLSAS